MAVKRKPSAIVIGAGVGGVSTAARLAKAGFTVTVIEKNAYHGGRCSLIHHNGWRFDQGPSLLLLPDLFKQTFADLDTTLEAEDVHLLKCEPNYNIWFGDGAKLELSTDLARMKLEVEKYEGKDGFDRYLSFLRESHAHYELSVSHVLLKNFTSALAMLRFDFLRHLVPLHPFESIYGRAARYFWSERLRRAFTFGSMYMGMSPFDAPGTYSLLQYTELAEGIWYPRGGFNKVVEALVNVGKRLGVEYRFSTSVDKITLDSTGNRTTGVLLSDGTHLSADVVINNSDLVYAYQHLLPSSHFSRALSERPASCSSISFYWSLDRPVPELETHNVFLADEYRQSFDSIFKRHSIPDEPSFYVNVPSRIDPTAAPSGKETIVVLVPVGHLTAPSQSSSPSQPGVAAPTTTDQDWPAMIALARKTILQTIKSRTGVDIDPHILHERTNDPVSWQKEFNLDRGAILGLSHSFFNVLCFRPGTKARRFRGRMWEGRLSGLPGRIVELLSAWDVYENLYMVGASAHPGTGVPICLAGGKLVAEQVCDDVGMHVPWRRSEVEARQRMSGLASRDKTGLDRLQGGTSLGKWNIGLVVGVCCAVGSSGQVKLGDMLAFVLNWILGFAIGICLLYIPSLTR